MDTDNEYNHAPSSSAAILKGLQGPVGTSYDHSPYVVVLQAASRGLTSHYLLMCVGRGVRGGGKPARVRHRGSVACIQVAAPKSRGERKGERG